MQIGPVGNLASSSGLSRMGAGHFKMPDKLVNEIADKLGINADDLKSQLDSGQKLDDILKSIGINKEDFDAAVKSAMKDSGMPEPPPSPPMHSSSSDQIGEKVFSAIADKLGTSTDELQTQLDSGQTLSDILNAKGMSAEDLRAAIEDALQSWMGYDQTGQVSTSQSGDWTPPIQIDTKG